MLSLSTIVQVRVNASSAAINSTAFSTGLLLVPVSTAVADDKKLQLFASPADMLTAGFQATDPAYLAAVAYFAASPAPDRLYVAQYKNDTTAADAFRDILNTTTDFYAVCLVDATESRVSAFIQSFDSLTDRAVLFYAATGTVSAATGTSGILRIGYTTGSNRVLGIYGADIYAAAAVMGTAMGLSRAYNSGEFALCYQQIPGMLPTTLTESEIAEIKSLSGNIYITRGKSRLLLENGTVASGKRFDEVLALDRIATDLQDAAISLLTSGSGKLPQTDETSAVFINRFSAVLSDYTSAGVLATSRWRGAAVGSLLPGDTIENGYLLWADSYDLQSDADRAARKAMPIHVALCLAGSVETLLIDIDVSI